MQKSFWILFELVSHGRQNICSERSGAFEILYCSLLVTGYLKAENHLSPRNEDVLFDLLLNRAC